MAFEKISILGKDGKQSIVGLLKKFTSISISIFILEFEKMDFEP